MSLWHKYFLLMDNTKPLLLGSSVSRHWKHLVDSVTWTSEPVPLELTLDERLSSPCSPCEGLSQPSHALGTREHAGAIIRGHLKTVK